MDNMYEKHERQEENLRKLADNGKNQEPRLYEGEP